MNQNNSLSAEKTFQKERLSDISWLALIFYIILLIVLLKEILIQFDKVIFYLPADKKGWKDHQAVHGRDETPERLYLVFENLNDIILPDGIKIGLPAESFTVFSDYPVFQSNEIVGCGFFYKIIVFFMIIIGKKIKLLFVEGRVAIGSADSTQIFDGKKNTVFKVVFTETVFPIFCQNIREQVIMINGRHAIYGIHIIRPHADA
jgi:hypothetical protein